MFITPPLDLSLLKDQKLDELNCLIKNLKPKNPVRKTSQKEKRVHASNPTK